MAMCNLGSFNHHCRMNMLLHRPVSLDNPTLAITWPQEATTRTGSPLVAALVHGDVGLPTRQI
jgi:hypothetical protein